MDSPTQTISALSAFLSSFLYFIVRWSNWIKGGKVTLLLPPLCNAHRRVFLGSTKHLDSQDYGRPHRTLAYSEGHRIESPHARKAVSDIPRGGNLYSSLLSRPLRCKKTKFFSYLAAWRSAANLNDTVNYPDQEVYNQEVTSAETNGRWHPSPWEGNSTLDKFREN